MSTGLTRDDLTTIALRTGRRVVAAWSDHDQGAMGTAYGVVLHHTGTDQSTAATAPTLQIVREGRADLQNALSAYYIDKRGTVYLITEKIAWHAGQGAYKGLTDGNGHLIGIEAESDGVTWTSETVDAYVALVAEICRYLGVDVYTWAIRHATWATPPGRKTDFAGLDEAVFKARVTARLAPATAPTSGAATLLGDDMPTVFASAGKSVPVLAVGGLFVELHDPNEQANALWAFNPRRPAPDQDKTPEPVWLSEAALDDLIAQSQQAVRGGTAT